MHQSLQKIQLLSLSRHWRARKLWNEMVSTSGWFAVWRDVHLWELPGVTTAFFFGCVVGQVRSKALFVSPRFGHVDCHRLFHPDDNFGVESLVVKQRVECPIRKMVGIANADSQSEEAVDYFP